MSRDDVDHDSHNRFGTKSKMCCSGYSEHSFEHIEQQNNYEGWPAQNASDIARADIAAALLPDVESRAPTRPIIARGETPQRISQEDERELLAGQRRFGRKRYAHVRCGPIITIPPRGYAINLALLKGQTFPWWDGESTKSHLNQAASKAASGRFRHALADVRSFVRNFRRLRVVSAAE